MREMQRTRVGMQGIGWECGCGKSAWEYKESRWKCGKMGNQGGNVGNQSGNLSTSVEMT